MSYDELAATVGRRIRRLRRAQALSQEALAERAGLHAVHLGRIERGVTNPTMHHLWDIAEALGTTVPDLFGREDVEPAGRC